jgi:glucan biosynthesis protein
VVLEGQVVFTRRLEIDAATWAAEEYPRLKAFFEKVQDADRQSLVLAREGA